MCGSCGKEMEQDCSWFGIEAKVLGVGGWHVVDHVPKRCRKKGCDRKDKLVWHNFWTDNKSAWWWWPHGHQMEYFFMWPGWG